MRIVKSCEECLYDRQAARVKDFADREKAEAYLSEIREILANRQKEDSSPYIVYCFNRVFARYYGHNQDYRSVKKEYNDFVLSMEKELEEKIGASPEPLRSAMRYARIGNYIDFGALDRVDMETFLGLFEKDGEAECSDRVFESFLEECAHGKHFLLLADNCGEIVLDKLFIRQLKREFPQLSCAVMVRGQEVLNDATVEDAVYCGIGREAEIISNGTGVAGTVIGMLSADVRKRLDEADVIFSKGQGNYETLSGCGLHIFYSFLCKCRHFTSRFHVPMLTGMLVEEGARKAKPLPPS